MEEKTLKINSLEINCQSLIEFSSLIKVLLELAKKQQETEKKLDEHDTKINDLMKTITNINNNNNQKEHKENNLSFIDDEINFNNFNDFNMGNDFDKTVINETKYLDKENPEADNKEKTNEENKKEKDENTKENKEKKESDNDNNIIIIENQINDNDNKINEDENQIKKEKEEEKEKVIPIGTANNMDFITINKNINNANNIVNDSNKNNNSINNNNINTNTQSEKKVKQEPITIIKHVDKSSSKSNEIISKLIQRIIVLEKKVAELNSKSNDNMILRTINSNKKNLIAHTESIKNLKEQTEKLGKELTNIKERLQDFNIYDMFKEGGDGDVDITKALIKALESKTNKRFDLFEEKYKLLSTENFKNKDDIKNQGILINGQKIIIEKNNEKISKLLEDQKNKEISDKELKEKENEELNKKFEEIIKSIEALGENYDNKLLELEKKLSEQQKQSPVLVTDIKPEKKQDKKKLENENIIKEYNERILELEKNMRQLLKKLNIEELNSNLAILQKEISKKGNQGAIDELIDRLYNVDENIKQINYRVDLSQAFEKKMIEENSLLSRKFETFANQVNRLSLQVIKNPKDDKPIIDYNKFIEIGVFEENKKETSRKFDKIRISFEDILKHIDEILDRLSHTPSDKDFSQYQEIIKSMLDEYRINNNKKYADKYDTSKNFKFLETQIKSITESYNKKLDGQDNWLLAKKPLNNYLCASCEGIIKGELDKDELKRQVERLNYELYQIMQEK